MKLALRKTAATNATILGRLFSWIVKWWLFSRYCHGGVVIDNVLYHMTPHGLQETNDWNPSRWDLYDTDANDKKALKKFRELKKKKIKYDFVSILFRFVFTFAPDDRSRLYCFEFCAVMMGLKIDKLVTAETLLIGAINAR